VRESEAHYRHFLDFNPSLFWTADPAGRVTVAGDRDAALLGLSTRLDDLGGYGAHVHADDCAAVEGAIGTALATGEPLDHVYRFRMAHGRYRWIHTLAKARRDARGNIVRW
jgi:PAS domain S-box-containing protein